MSADIESSPSAWPDVTRAIRTAKILVIGQDDIKNEAQAAAVIAAIRAFGDSPAGFIYIEPCTARSTRRPPDIVLCHPDLGVVVFEVKGYSSSAIDSVKAGSLFIRRDGLIRPVNAFRQAEQSMFDIKNQVDRANGAGTPTPAFHAVVVLPNFTQTEWKNRGFAANFPAEVLLLKEELSPDSLKAKLKALVGRHQGRPLTPQQIEVVRRVFGDSAAINDPREARAELVETSLGSVIDEMAVMDKYLSTEQSELSRLPIAGFPRLVRGVAGSGKTVVLANLVARLLNRQKNMAPGLFDDMKNEHLKVAVICFNRALVPFLRQKIKDAYTQQTFEEIPSADILWMGHLNSLMRKITYQRSPDLSYINIKTDDSASDRAVQYTNQIQSYLQKHPESGNALLYDAIFVDEGQDFEPEEFQLLLSLLKPDKRTGEKNLVIFYDDAQNLYGRQRPNWRQVGIDVQRGDRARVMKECFRNTREIVETAFNVLLGSESTAETKVKLKTYADVGYLRQAELIEEIGSFYKVGFAERTGEYPSVQVFASREREKEWIASEVQRLLCTEQVRPEDVLILFNYPLVFEDLGNMIQARLGKEYPLNFVRPFGKGGDQDTFIFKEKSLTLSTVHGAKGYDAYVVFLAGADLFKEDEAGRASFYVGATRAKLALHITGLKSAVLTETRKVIERARSLRDS